MQGKPLVDHDELRQIDDLSRYGEHQAGEVAFDGSPIPKYDRGEWSPPARGVTLRKFQNGNGHVIFDPPTLLDINRALAEFYGEVLPDADDDEPRAKRASTDVAADLQFYPTPRAVIEMVLDEIGLSPTKDKWGDKHPQRFVLEPSCGDGRIMDVIRERGHHVIGFEVHAGRAATAKAKSHAVVLANFLEQPADPRFDFVVMNPPFYGRHWKKHLDHARQFVKPDGALACILPASAWPSDGRNPISVRRARANRSRR